ncbi:hypothetical protein GH714_013361 [Hevea brasiliensis]|uniref:Uncharacterized protein n=1 Tax=Hevea brasiliensis TaxID=3981 RepID=A0A6A6MZ67_HEVBR|nr:hypothetical protein GH714_013361 [Hevea brasiliensis]
MERVLNLIFLQILWNGMDADREVAHVDVVDLPFKEVVKDMPKLWGKLEYVADCYSIPWCLIGNFNAMLSSNEENKGCGIGNAMWGQFRQ